MEFRNFRQILGAFAAHGIFRAIFRQEYPFMTVCAPNGFWRFRKRAVVTVTCAFIGVRSCHGHRRANGLSGSIGCRYCCQLPCCSKSARRPCGSAISCIMAPYAITRKLRRYRTKADGRFHAMLRSEQGGLRVERGYPRTTTLQKCPLSILCLNTRWMCHVVDQDPARVMFSIRIEPVRILPHRSTSLPTATICRNMSRMFPAIVISSTGYWICPFSTQKPAAPRE